MRIDTIIKEFYSGDVSKLVVVIRDFNKPRKISGREITGVKKDGFFMGRTFIPCHRIMSVECG